MSNTTNKNKFIAVLSRVYEINRCATGRRDKSKVKNRKCQRVEKSFDDPAFIANRSRIGRLTVQTARASGANFRDVSCLRSSTIEFRFSCISRTRRRTYVLHEYDLVARPTNSPVEGVYYAPAAAVRHIDKKRKRNQLSSRKRTINTRTEKNEWDAPK